MKFTSAAFAFLTCVTLLFTTEVIAVRIQPRCNCPKTYSGNPIDPKLILKVQMIPAGGQCKNVEVIATLKTGKTCLNHKDEWVKKIIEG